MRPAFLSPVLALAAAASLGCLAPAILAQEKPPEAQAAAAPPPAQAPAAAPAPAPSEPAAEPKFEGRSFNLNIPMSGKAVTELKALASFIGKRQVSLGSYRDRFAKARERYVQDPSDLHEAQALNLVAGSLLELKEVYREISQRAGPILEEVDRSLKSFEDSIEGIGKEVGGSRGSAAAFRAKASEAADKLRAVATHFVVEMGFTRDDISKLPPEVLETIDLLLAFKESAERSVEDGEAHAARMETLQRDLENLKRWLGQERDSVRRIRDWAAVQAPRLSEQARQLACYATGRREVRKGLEQASELGAVVAQLNGMMKEGNIDGIHWLGSSLVGPVKNDERHERLIEAIWSSAQAGKAAPGVAGKEPQKRNARGEGAR